MHNTCLFHGGLISLLGPSSLFLEQKINQDLDSKGLQDGDRANPREHASQHGVPQEPNDGRVDDDHDQSDQERSEKVCGAEATACSGKVVSLLKSLHFFFVFRVLLVFVNSRT